MNNCENCIHLEFYETYYYEGEGPGGYICNKRNYLTRSEERRHLDLLDKYEYRITSKRCHQALDPKVGENK